MQHYSTMQLTLTQSPSHVLHYSIVHTMPWGSGYGWKSISWLPLKAALMFAPSVHNLGIHCSSSQSHKYMYVHAWHLFQPWTSYTCVYRHCRGSQILVTENSVFFGWGTYFDRISITEALYWQKYFQTLHISLNEVYTTTPHTHVHSQLVLMAESLLCMEHTKDCWQTPM